eukprot:s800_g10.t1
MASELPILEIPKSCEVHGRVLIEELQFSWMYARCSKQSNLDCSTPVNISSLCNKASKHHQHHMFHLGSSWDSLSAHHSRWHRHVTVFAPQPLHMRGAPQKQPGFQQPPPGAQLRTCLGAEQAAMDEQQEARQMATLQEQGRMMQQRQAQQQMQLEEIAAGQLQQHQYQQYEYQVHQRQMQEQSELAARQLQYYSSTSTSSTNTRCIKDRCRNKASLQPGNSSTSTSSTNTRCNKDRRRNKCRWQSFGSTNYQVHQQQLRQELYQKQEEVAQLQHALGIAESSLAEEKQKRPSASHTGMLHRACP